MLLAQGHKAGTETPKNNMFSFKGALNSKKISHEAEMEVNFRGKKLLQSHTCEGGS
jgi:hypothetical protein